MPAAALLLAAALTVAPQPFDRTESRVPCADYTPLRRPLFGDLHVHTRYSLDASTQGTRTSPTQAYAFARGAPLGIQPWDDSGTAGRRVELRRPLDFAAVTDHSELFGETTICQDPLQPGHSSLMCQIYRGWPRLAFFLMNARGTPFGFCGEDRAACSAADALPWADMHQAAEAAYDRTAACEFTSFIGYEWTGYTHRNVIFRNATVPAIAPSSAEFPHETQLWDELERTCRNAPGGCDFVVIPHNSNVSNETTFRTTRPDGNAFDAADARRRITNEPLVEMMQHKGSSECYRGAGTEDELCGFENVPYDDLRARFVPWMRSPPAATNFVRTALGIGLRERMRIGVNPFEIGFIGSTDTHLGTPGLVYERDYPGHGGAGVPIGSTLPDRLLDPIEFNPGGLAAVWAEENSRDAIFAALQRRETYATSGPRIVVRLFAGADLPNDLCESPDFAAVGYADGVPMGGSLHARDLGGRPPKVAVRALKDPGTAGHPGSGLQKLQIIKVWVEGKELRQRVVDVAGSNETTPIDPANCRPAESGAGELCAVWTDTDHSTDAPSTYYARVIEQPTCRWSAHACNAAGIDCRAAATIRSGWEACCDERFPKTIQERAWTSPVWYSPEQ